MRYQSDDQSFRFAPTDLYHFIHCSHLSLLEREAEKGIFEKPPISDPYFHLITERGRKFEENYVRHLETKGKEIVRIPPGNHGEAFAATLQAMEAGADYIIQGRLEYGDWGGFADILRKVPDRSSRWGEWSYEVMDTKLALKTKAGSVMQLAVYTDMLTHIQDCEPECMYVVHPGPGEKSFEEEPYRYANYAAYYRHLKKQFGEMIGTEELVNSYPDPVPHCEQCTWWQRCEKQRRDDDHLTYVAGMSRMAITELEGHGIPTLHALATGEPAFRPHRGQKETYIKLHQQANIQDRGRTQHENLYELLPVIRIKAYPGKEILLLPAPSRVMSTWTSNPTVTWKKGDCNTSSASCSAI
ncbi:MAG: TM0106 family RecB-like putative nuclease [Saprospiraceae bacterium]